MTWWAYYMAKVHLPSRLCDTMEKMDRVAWRKGTSMDMETQVVPYQAIAMLREELYILEQPPFQHFPQRTKMNGVYRFLMLLPLNTLYERRMTELLQCQTLMIHCLESGTTVHPCTLHRPSAPGGTICNDGDDSTQHPLLPTRRLVRGSHLI